MRINFGTHVETKPRKGLSFCISLFPWNIPTRLLASAQVGDRIVAVNGTSGASQAIFDTIKDTQEAVLREWVIPSGVVGAWEFKQKLGWNF